jgi:hypothetical protein
MMVSCVLRVQLLSFDRRSTIEMVVEVELEVEMEIQVEIEKWKGPRPKPTQLQAWEGRDSKE